MIKNSCPCLVIHFLTVLVILAQFLLASASSVQGNVVVSTLAREHMVEIQILDDSGSLKSKDLTNLRYNDGPVPLFPTRSVVLPKCWFFHPSADGWHLSTIPERFLNESRTNTPGNCFCSIVRSKITEIMLGQVMQ